MQGDGHWLLKQRENSGASHSSRVGALEIGRKAVELAKSGDTVALRLCLERIAPVRKGRPITLSLPYMSTSADVTTALSAM